MPLIIYIIILLVANAVTLSLLFLTFQMIKILDERLSALEPDDTDIGGKSLTFTGGTASYAKGGAGGPNGGRGGNAVVLGGKGSIAIGGKGG